MRLRCMGGDAFVLEPSLVLTVDCLQLLCQLFRVLPYEKTPHAGAFV